MVGVGGNRGDTAGGFTFFSIDIPLSVSKKGAAGAAGSRTHQWAQCVGALPKGWLTQGLMALESEEDQGQGPLPAAHFWPHNAARPRSGKQMQSNSLNEHGVSVGKARRP